MDSIKFIEVILHCILFAFLLRTLSHMLMFASQFGGLLYPAKTWVMKMLDKELYDRIVRFEPEKLSNGEKITEILIDNFAAKYKLVHLMSCVYCIGFWLSICLMIPLLFINLCYLILPIITYFMIEKI